MPGTALQSPRSVASRPVGWSITLEARRGGDDDRRGIRTLDEDPFRKRLLGATFADDLGGREKGIQPFPPARCPIRLRRSLPTISVRASCGLVDPGAEAERSRLVDGQANHDDLIGVAGEDFTRVPHAIDAIADARDGFVQVQLASILRNCSS